MPLDERALAAATKIYGDYLEQLAQVGYPLSRETVVQRTVQAYLDALASRPVEADMVLVPQSALDWLFGSGPDASGKWFGESEDAFPTIKSLGDKPPRYWWRAHFRSLVPALAAAAPAQAKEGKETP